MVVRPRCRARVGCCQSNGAGYPKGCPAPLVFGIAARTTAVVCPNKGCLGKLLTHFADCSSASFNFYSAFLGGRCLAQFIVASLMRRKFRKKLAPLLFLYIRTQKFLCEAQKAFGEHNWRESITRRARTARIGVSQPNQTRAKDVRLLLFYGYPLARQRTCRAVCPKNRTDDFRQPRHGEISGSADVKNRQMGGGHTRAQKNRRPPHRITATHKTRAFRNSERLFCYQ